ncbi:glycosyltransferase family 4 protein [Nocardiopsis coralliicola]
MRIAQVVATSSGGVGTHVHSLTRELVARGHRVAVLGPAATEERFAFTGAGAAFRAADIGAVPRPLHDAAAAAALSGPLAGADAVHAHGVRAEALAALAGARPLVVTLHNAPPGDRRGAAAYRLLERWTAVRADAVRGVSSDLVGRMRALGARRTALELAAADPPAPPRRPRAAVRTELLGPHGYRPLLLTVARLAPQKGLDVLLDAAAKADAAGPPHPLFAVAGDGPLRRVLADRIAAEDLPVRLLGHRADIADLLAAADGFVLSSWWEGPSLVVMEALAAGLPVVSTRVGGIADSYAGAALLTPPGDAAALAAAVRRVLTEPGLADRLGDTALTRAARLPGAEAVADQAEGVYVQVATETRR